MAEKNFQKNGARVNSQKCSLCKEPGHNKGSARCPVNLLKAQTEAIAAQRKESFKLIQIKKKATILPRSAKYPVFSTEKIRLKLQSASRMTFLV